MKKKLTSILLFITVILSITVLLTTPCRAESIDKREERVKKERAVKTTFAGGPGYSSDLGVILANNLISTFRFKGEDKNSEASVVPLSLILYFGDDIGYKLLLKPQLFINNENIIISGNIQYNNTFENYFGVGYDTNINITPGDNTTQYRNRNLLINGAITRRIGEGNFFIGAQYKFQHNIINEPSDGVVNDIDYINFGGDASGIKVTNSGFGINLSYDTRDNLSNTYSGKLFKADIINYGKYFGGEYNFNNLKLDYKHFISLSKRYEGHILAWMVTSNLVSGDTPFIMLPTVGSANDLRGYYMGQYRDKITSMILLEYRHKINTNRATTLARIVDRLGFVTWSGVGVIGNYEEGIGGYLPNYGAGIRVRMQERLNFRFDLGYNPINKDIQVYFGVYEAF